MSSATPPSFNPVRTQIKELDGFVRQDTKDVVAKLLYENHESHHCFFNDKGMHNHAIHQMIAGLTLGASPDEIKKHYDYQQLHVLHSFKLNNRDEYDPFVNETATKVDKVTEENWTRYLGNPRYYWSYLHFFDQQLAADGIVACLERFVFAPDANKPELGMLNRFFGGVIHALIHCGYGIELDTPGIVAEGLAMATSTNIKYEWLFPQPWLHSPTRTDGQGRRLLSIISDVLRDERLSYAALKLGEADTGLVDKPFKDGGSAHGLIHHYADQWAAFQSNGNDPLQTDMAIDDLSLLSALMLGAVPRKPDAYHHDFFLMHLNNAHLFTRLFLSILAPENRVVFLRALLAQFLFYYVARGRPHFTAAHWVQEDKVAKDLDWPSLFSAATSNFDEHCVKAVRTLYFFSTQPRDTNPLEQMANAGLIDKKDVDQLHGADPFLLTARQIVRMHQGKIKPSKHSGEMIGSDTEFWDFDKFVEEEAKL